MEDAGSDKSPMSCQEGQPLGVQLRGKVIYRFTPKDFKVNIATFVLLYGVLLFFFIIITPDISFIMDSSGFYIVTLLFALGLFLTYIMFISTFDDIIFYENGFYPPVQIEKPLNMLRRKRSFIYYSEISNFGITPVPFTRSPFIVFMAHGRMWSIFRRWDTQRIYPIMQTAVAFKFLKVPDESIESGVQLKEKGA